jgi:hypothetical protein
MASQAKSREAAMYVDSAKKALPIAPGLSAVFFACLPKCPLCFTLLLAPLGFSLPHRNAFLVVTGWVLLAAPLGALYWLEGRNGRSSALWIGTAGALLMGTGRFLSENAPLVIIGSALMMTAFLWAAHLRRHCSRTSYPLTQEADHGH